MLSNDLNYLNVTYTVEIHPTWEFKSCNFQYIFLNWIISVNYEAKITKFGICIDEGHSEELCLRFRIYVLVFILCNVEN